MKNVLKRKTIVKGLLCIIWIGIVFYNGTRQGSISQRDSEEVTKVISVFMNTPLVTVDNHSIKFSNVNYL